MLLCFAKRVINPEQIVSIAEPVTESGKGRVLQIVELETTRSVLRESFDTGVAAKARYEELIIQLEGCRQHSIDALAEAARSPLPEMGLGQVPDPDPDTDAAGTGNGKKK